MRIGNSTTKFYRPFRMAYKEWYFAPKKTMLLDSKRLAVNKV